LLQQVLLQLLRLLLLLLGLGGQASLLLLAPDREALI